MFNFEKLDVWNEAIAFADSVYTITRTFPNDERFGLANQMRRAAVSISSNIAEGSSRSSRADFARFIEIATGSVFEVVSQATVSKRQAFLSESNYAALYAARKAEQDAQWFETLLGRASKLTLTHQLSTKLGLSLRGKRRA